mmetsp:Transcript_36617/g.56264  ORF Transcript_36617/g.56264 Transcript_36617/m.56264 type:complete len:140 (+) Transcript_36617:366-785(+)
MRSSYCTGENGKIANDEANEKVYGTGAAGSAELAQAREMLKAIPRNERNPKSDVRPTGSKLYGEADQHATFDDVKLKEALEKEEKRKINSDKDERKRKYNSMSTEVDVTEEEMEAYRQKRDRADDPMAKISNNGELLEY